jgi:predicted RNase H-like HicB family nuclease
MKYLIVIEQTSTGFSAYSPDLPGCVTAGSSRDEVEREMAEAISLHLEGLQQEGQKPPSPSSVAAHVDVTV